ncbi:MAG: filamentous hemagglutinin N-terminal domain-containing protein, partial [Victivallales bacterium]|nr:filamentous hemagglutinin N-terminal domain-containing protein [Victivallales bacterium]
MNLITRTRKPTKFQKAMAAFMAAFLLFSPSGLMARNLPAGAKVVKGKVNIRTSGDVMDIDQLSTKAIVNWRTFDIGEANTVNVNQPSSLGKAAMLARVVGNDPSSIFGKLNADQTFYLVNPNGVYFGKNSRVDVGAAFAASTLDITDADFLSGRVIFKGDSKASIINEGAINAASVALIAKDVANKGTINAAQIAVVGTNEVELFNFGNDAKLTLKFADTADASTAVNEGELNGASDVILFADNGKADNSNGIIRAENAEISGAYVDILNLGDIEAKSLVIDPDGKLYIGNFEDKAPRWTPALGGDPDDPNYTPNPDEFTGGDGTSTQDAAGDFYLSTTSLNNFLNKYAENGLSELKLEYTDGIIVQDNVAIQTEGGNVSLALDAKDSNLRIGDNFVWGGAADLKLSGATITVDGKFTATNNLSVVEFNAPKGIVSNGANPVDIRVNKLNVANKETGFIADGDLSIAVSTDKMIVDYDILSKDGDVTLQALDVAGAIFVRGGSIKANGTISMKAANDIQVKNAEGNADPVLYANDINIEALQFTTEAPIEANNALNLNVAVIGDLASDADDIAVAGDINVLGLVGTDTLSINANLLSGKAVTVNADSSIAANAAILAEDNVVITAGQFGKVKIADTIAATNVSITAGRGAIELTDDGSINADNTIGLTAYDVYLKFEEATSPVLSADVINIDAWQFSNATETTASAPIDAANALNIKAAVIGVVGNADINVAGDINIQGQTGNDTLTINSSLESGHS